MNWILPAWMCFWSFCAPTPENKWVLHVAPFHKEIMDGNNFETTVYHSHHQAGPFNSKQDCEAHRALVQKAFEGETVYISECNIQGEQP